MICTTEPPTLSPDHPVRKLFLRHGNLVARHAVRWILISVVIAVVLCYPVALLYSNNPTTGHLSLPHHVWTSARSLEGIRGIKPDIAMRQAWVHGSFMRAVEPGVLTEALHIQEALLGPTSGCEYLRSVDDSGTIDDSAVVPVSFFHSPLLYWNCSIAAIEADRDLLETVNERSRRVSSVNLTLRHSTVFAGKTFSMDRLIAADALVITFFHGIDPEIEELWNSRAEKLAKDASERLSLYPADGKISRFHLYEFRFEPMSLREDILLGIAYALMVLYIAINLRRLRAVKSKLVLVVTVIAQIGISIFSSFTICALFKVDLSQIPRELYPFVVLAIGIENMFQLINAVLATPPEVPTVSRVSSALGNIGHLALARAAQNLFVLWLLSQVVWVPAFCVFSSIAVVFDLFFHLTFFLAVLSVDMQRMDLQDSLDRVDPVQGNNRMAGVGKQRWIDALLQGRIPFSTRVAGTAITVCFVTVLNWHFLDNKNPVQSFSRLMNVFRLDGSARTSEVQTTLTVTVNQARSPTSWLRLQDHDTAKEVIRLVKPHAHSFVAQVYDPLIFVIKGANRDQPGSVRTMPPYRVLPIIPDATREHTLPFILLVVLALAVVTLLINYLLWNEISDIMGSTDFTEPALSIKTYSGGHALDIVILSTSASGVLVSVGLDRQIVVWDLTTGRSSNVTEKFRLMEAEKPFWPVVALALDDSANWLAICSRSGLVSFLDLQHQNIAQPIDLDLGEHQTSILFFTPERDTLNTRLIMVKADGWVIEIDPRTFDIFKQRPCHGKVISAHTVLVPKSPLMVTIATKLGCICNMIRTADWWEEEKFGFAEQLQMDKMNSLPLSGTLLLPELGLLLVVGRCEARLVDPQLGVVIHKFKTSQIKANSLRAIHSRVRRCSTSGTGYGVSSFSISYTESETHNFTMHTFTPNDKQKNVICLHATENSAESNCQGFANATQTLHQMHDPGVWEATTANCAIGVRRQVASSHGRNYSALDAFSRAQPRRRVAREREAAKAVEVDYDWEAWTMSAAGEVNTCPISMKSASGELFVNKVGPICRVGECSIAVGLGNSIKLVVAGNERFGNRDSRLEDFSFTATGHRKKM